MIRGLTLAATAILVGLVFGALGDIAEAAVRQWLDQHRRPDASAEPPLAAVIPLRAVHGRNTPTGDPEQPA